MNAKLSLPVKRAAAVLVSVGFAASGWTLAHPRAPGVIPASSRGVASASAATVPQAPADPRALPARRWRAGDSFVYKVDAARVIKLGAPLDREIDIKLAGTLAITVVGAEAGSLQLRADLRAARYEQKPGADHDPKAELASPFYFTASRAGALGSFHFPRRMSAEARGILKGLAASLQLVSSPRPQTTWQTVEQDVSGEYEAAYTRGEAGVHKVKTRYLRGRGAKGLVPRNDGEYAVQSSNELVVDDSGWPRSAAEDETLNIELGGSKVRAVNKATAKLITIERRLDLIGAMNDAEVESEAVSEAAAFAGSRVQADRGLVGGRTFQVIAADFTSPDADARSHARARLSALMRLDPSAVGATEDAILHGGFDPLTKSRMAAALGSAGTPESQTALMAILETRGASVPARVDASAVLGLEEEPSPEAQASLRKAMGSSDKEVATTATLALGNTVRTVNAAAGDSSDAVATLIALLQSAADDSQRILCLQALGNTGDARALAAIGPYLTSADTTLRAVATGALKFMVGATADAAIMAAFGDKEIEVRRAAVGTVAFRPIAAVLAALDHLLRTDPEEAIRLAIVNALNVRLHDDPSIADALGWAAANDASEKVRKLAKQVLGQAT